MTRRHVAAKPERREKGTLGRVRHRRHLFVCVQHRDGGGKPACGDRGGSEILGRLEALLMRQPESRIGVTGTQCLGPCFDGPNVVVYPEGVWYAELVPDDAAAILDGTIAPTKRHPWSDEGDEDA